MKSLHKKLFISFLFFLCFGFFIYKLYTNTNNLTHIEKVIKKHNNIKESIENPKYPTIAKPVSTQSTVINGDSIRVSQKETDSVDDYLRYWYEVLDTNSDGEIDDTINK